MDRQERIDLIIDHYENPRHLGPLHEATVVQTGVNDGCGDEVTVYLRANGRDEGTALAFEGQGCTISQAAASMVVELMQGWSLDRIEEATAQPILDLLGPDIVAARLRCATLAFHAVKEAGRQARQR